MEMRLTETDNFLEIDVKLPDGTKIGTAEVEPINHVLERFNILEPYQNKGYGQKVLKQLIDKYQIKSLWVRSDNERAIHVYEKTGFRINKAVMYEMVLEVSN